jgi:hypothetical protein
MNDIDEEMGPMHIISKKETKKIITNGFSKYQEGLSNGIIENKCKVKKFVGPRGVALLADTNLCLHRGDILKKDTYRDMLVFYIISSKEEYSGINPINSSGEQFFGFKRLFSN